MNRSLRKLLTNARFGGLRYEAIGHSTTNAPFPPVARIFARDLRCECVHK
jgi:hypothetical protein